jgi:hypothetical protein
METENEKPKQKRKYTRRKTTKQHDGMFAPKESRKSCPMCNSVKSKVVKSWIPEGTVQRRRRRLCTDCNQVYNTVEWNADK